VRHGRTALNDPKNPKLRAWEEVPLTDEGRAEIQLTANKLKIYSPKMIYSSDLERDTESAMLMAAILGNIPYETDFCLRTADMGTLSGKPEAGLSDFITRWYTAGEQAPSGETRPQFRKRMWKFMEPKIELAREVAAFRPTIFICHGRIHAEFDMDYNHKLPEDAMIPMPGGFGVLRSNIDGIDTFENIGETERMLTDV
jgi:broad specificity phosphatase PhoE